MSERYTPCPVCKGEVSHHAACSVPVLGPPAGEVGDCGQMALAPAARQERDGLRARVAQLFDVHRLTIGDGDDMSPDTCTCGRWEATTLDTAEADRQWQRHLADEVLAALDAGDEQGRPA